MTAGRAHRASWLIIPLVAMVALAIFVGTRSNEPEAASAAPPAAESVPTTAIRLSRTDSGRVFAGIGAISGGGNTSRLLADYPAAERNQILDYLFRPDYGASLQMLKVEIGSDTDTTEGAEPSIERSPGSVVCTRDAEWRMIRAAQQRNPTIKVAALEWGAPGWLRGGFWSRDNIDYLLNWLGCAQQQGLRIDYLGGWNERGFQPSWYAALAAAVRRAYPHIKIIAADSTNWQVSTALQADPAFARAVSIVGVHHPCRPEWRAERCTSPVAARMLKQPLWASEESAEDFNAGAGPLARELNLNYIDGRMTGTIIWSAVSAFYDNLPLAGRALMLAEQPWSGAYQVGREIWVVAQTTQFAQPGWRYLDHASGPLPLGGSYVSLRAPQTGHSSADWSTIAETSQATGPQTLQLLPGRGLRHGRLHVWCTDLRSADPSSWFVRKPNVRLGRTGATFTMSADQVCSLTTTRGQHRGTAVSPPGSVQPLPYTANLTAPLGHSPADFFDINGAFEAAPCAGGLAAVCLSQQVEQRPIPWSTAGRGNPTTVVGDPRWWGNYTVRASVLLQHAPWIELVGRADMARGQTVSGYHLRLSATGDWQLRTETALLPPHRHDVGQGYALDRVLARGRLRPPVGWQRLALRMIGDRITAMIDGRSVATVTDPQHNRGQVGLVVGGYDQAQVAALSVTPTTPAPRYVPRSAVSATASSQRYEYQFDVDDRAGRALDYRPATLWESTKPPSPVSPQSLTLWLAHPQRLNAVAVMPPANGTATGMITTYRILTSADGQHFTAVAGGRWQPGTETHLVALPRLPVRAVRLVATSAIGRYAAVAEMRLITGQAAARR